MSEHTQTPAGWKWLMNASKWHYFVDGRSLCGRWMALSNSDLDDTNDDSTDNCTGCRRRLKSRRALSNEREG